MNSGVMVPIKQVHDSCCRSSYGCVRIHSGFFTSHGRNERLQQHRRCSRPTIRSAPALASASEPSAAFVDAKVELDERRQSSVLCSTSDVDPGTVMFAVPEAQVLNTDTVAASAIADAVLDQAGWVQLALFLIHAEVNSDSTWGSFLQNFEQSAHPPVVLWSDSQLQAIEGTQVYETACEYRAFFQKKFEQLSSGVLSKLDGATAGACTLERFVLAAAAVRARIFPPYTVKDPCVPQGVDMVQHSRKPNVKLQFSGGSLFKRQKTLQIIATQRVAQGQALTLDYAPGKLESQVALDYGVYDSEASQPGYLLTLSLPGEEEDACFYDKQDIVEQEGLADSATFTLHSSAEPPADMLAYLRLMNVGGEDKFLMEAVFRSDAWGFMQDPVSPQNEELVCTSMAEGCEAALQGYGTTAVQDLQALDGCDAAAEPQRFVALKVCLEEKRVLEDLAEWFRARLGRLGGLEYYQERRLKRLGLLDEDGNTTYEDMMQIM